MTYKKLLWPLLAIALIWSCGKDDDPAPPPAAPTIANFSPTSGPVGTVITINGTNFSTTNASNTVKIGTATATVSAATATKITATVPQGATTGKVSVTVGTQTATSTNDFTVTVPDVDDPDGDDPDGDDPDGDDPTNEAPTADEQSFEVAEDIAVGDVIGTATATDGDEDELTFALVTDESERFLVADNGEISLAEGKSLDFETTAEYSLTLSVSDGTNDPVEFSVTVTVTDVDEAPMAENQEFTVAEDIGMDEVIGTVEATDPEGGALTFVLTENDNELFAVTEAGEISLAEGKNLDFETKQSHSLTLEVSDGTNDPVEFIVSVNVTNVIESLAEDPEAFVLKFTVTAGQELTIGTHPDYAYDFTIDWGDGTVQENVTDQNPSNTYTAGDTYTVAIKGNFPALRMSSADNASRDALVDVAQWGTQKWQSMESAFRGCDNLVEFSATDAPDLTETTDMSSMFQSCNNFNGAIGHWDTGNVTDMNNMFSGAFSFNQPLVQQPGGWNTSNVTDMNNMFYQAAAFNQDLSSWDTSNVTNMLVMFFEATAFDQSLGDWDISSVTDMDSMLDDCGMSTENLNATLIGWANFVEENDGPSNITLGLEGLTICGTEVLTAGVILGAANWTTSGETYTPACP